MAPTGTVTSAAKTTPKKVPATEPRAAVPQMNLTATKQSDHTQVSFMSKAKAFVATAKSTSVETAKDPHVQACAASAAAGSVVLGACGGAVGLVAGGVIGLPFALFTLGLSVPISAMLGGGLGVVTGGAAGCATGGATGYTVFKWRKEIQGFVGHTWSKLKSTGMESELYLEGKIRTFVTSVKTTFDNYKRSFMYEAEKLTADVKDFTAPVVEKVQIVAKNPHAQVTAASAAAGGVAAAVPCGTIGLVGGAIVGFVPAVFTFGLSIPVFAAVGGGAGFCIGGATGALGGGAAGHCVYAKREEIREGAATAVGYVKKMFGRQ